jgi:hypothetical protein
VADISGKKIAASLYFSENFLIGVWPIPLPGHHLGAAYGDLAIFVARQLF